MTKDQQYEQAKKKLQVKCLTPAQYEKAIKRTVQEDRSVMQTPAPTRTSYPAGIRSSSAPVAMRRIQRTGSVLYVRLCRRILEMVENGKVIIRGWKAICVVMDLSPASYRSAMKKLKRAGLLRYEDNRPVVLLSEIEAMYRKK